MIQNFANIVGNKLQFIKDFFNIHDMNPEPLKEIEAQHPQIPCSPRTAFFEPERFESEFEEDVMSFFLEVIIETLEKLQTPEVQAQERDQPLCQALILVLDNASMMSQIDWKFYLQVTAEVQCNLQNFVIILSIDKVRQFIKPLTRKQVSTMDLAIHMNAKRYYESHVMKREDELFS